MVDLGPPRSATAARPAYADIVVAPVEVAAPIIAARRPAPERITGAECDTARDKPGADIAGRGKVIGRIVGIRPVAVDDAGVIIGNIHRIGIRRLDGDDLLVRHLLNLDGLLLGRCQLVVGLRLGAQTLDGIHHVRLLGHDRIAELLRPIELGAHHRQHVRCRYQRLDALIPILLVDGGLQRIAFEILVGLQPTFGLHDIERVGGRHQHLGQQRVRIERNRRHELIKFGGLQGLRICRGRGGRRRLRHRADRRQDDHGQQQGLDSPQHHRRLRLVWRSLHARVIAASKLNI